MKYVLDSCVAFKWVVTEPDTDKALRLREAFRNGVHELIAPDIFPIETGHALTRAERQGRITPPDGWAAWLSVMADCPQLVASIPDMPRAYAISSSIRTGIYDCLYVALAEREGCEFVTADDKLIRNLQVHFPFIVPLSSLT
ncbi:MAG: type II toxin-antitoxin system VapC family toxin [Gemmataceae bacterium]|nr:type II toxin-antitoxin system VapC family toxin [Gemmataceae bacterium]